METPATRSTMGDPSWVSCQLQWHDARLKRKGTKELEGRGPAKLLEGAATASPLRPTSSTSSSPVCIQGSNSSRTKDGNFCFCPPTPQLSLLVKRPSPRSTPSSDAQGWFKHCGYVSLEERMREKVAQSFCSPLVVRNFIVMDNPLIKRS